MEQKIKYNEIKLNQLEVDNYDVVTGYAGRARKPMVDWVTEYTYISDKSLTKEEFDKILENESVYGNITYKKIKLTFRNGKVLYKHICKAVMY